MEIDSKLIHFSNTPFYDLMKRRIHKVLIVASEYDSFTLEVDGRIDEQIFNEYVSLNLSNPPSIKHVSTAEDALKELQNHRYQLVITMLNVGQKFDAFEFAKQVKGKYPRKPVVILTPFSRKVSVTLEKEDLSAIDYVFSWLGSADVLLAIIKLIEDKMNVKHDIKVGVQIILLVEDSVRYYSGYLTHMYRTLVVQAKKLMNEGLNEHQKMMRMRGRPKILLAKNYEEAAKLYKTYKRNILGVIADTAFPRNGKIDPDAGVRFIKSIKSKNKYTPLLLQSSDINNSEKAKLLDIGFIHKYSETLTQELTHFMNTYFAFGAFEFKDPETGYVIKRTETLKDLQNNIFDIPNDSFEYHTTRNHLSKWLYARALFPIAEFIVNVTKEDFNNDIDKLKIFVHDNIANYRQSRSRGIIAEFRKDNYDNSLIFSRIGKGYMGGKARGLAFLDKLIKKHPELDKYENVVVKIPRTVVISTDIFDNYMNDNNLYPYALSEKPNEKILKRFLKAKLRRETIAELRSFLNVANFPIAIRSSSVLEDSHYQPFAGVFSTYMVPNTSTPEINLQQLMIAIKSVYASVFYKETKAYMKVTKNVIDDEKMGVVLQEICGNKFENRFYPTFSGVARSVNFYPIENEKPEEGIVNIALGLGKHIVEGKKTLRFSPEHPKKILQLSSPDIAFRDTQKTFFALDLNPESFMPSTDESVNYLTESIRQAQKDESIYDISSAYDYDFNILKEGRYAKGKRLITFANVLKFDSFPLAEIIKNVLKICEKAMNNPIEIEFAVNLTPKIGTLKHFNLLQIRPIVEDVIDDEIDFLDVKEEDIIISSETSLGHGVIKGIKDIVYVKPQKFDSTNNNAIVPVIEKINDKFISEDKNYILCGPGRWGSSDPWLGIPVKWSQISSARLIIESGLKNYRIEPSQGTHFFQNLTSFKVGYFTINPFKNDGFLNVKYLDKLDAFYEDEFVRHIRFNKDIIIKIDGKKSKGVVLKP